MARLNDEQKRFLVRRNACFIAPDTIKEEWQVQWPGEKLTDQQISQYDPTTANGDRDMGEELKAYFVKTRDTYIHDVEAVPIAHMGFRLNRLQQLLKHPLVQAIPRLEKELLEHAAKEVGGFYEKPKPPATTGGNTLQMIRDFLSAPIRPETEEGEAEAATGEVTGEAAQATETGETGDTSGESSSTGTGEAPVELGTAL